MVRRVFEKFDPDWNQRKKLKFFLKLSFFLHVSFFLLYFLGGWVFPGKPDLFLPSVQIDMVALPDQLKNQDNPLLDTTLPVKDAPPPPAKEEQAEEKEEPEPAPKEDTKEKDMALRKEKEAEADAKKALERLRSQMKKDQKKEEQNRRKELVNQREENLKRFEETYRSALKGNQTNQGSSSSGALQTIANAYYGRMREVIQSNWALPAYLQDKGLRAVVHIYIDARGNVIRLNLVQSSGNDVFDNNAKGAVNRSAFPPPPEEMSRGLRNSGVQVQFPL